MNSLLFPVQNVVRKLVQGEPLDDTTRFIVRSFEPTATSVTWTYEAHTERSYVRKLYNLGRCSVHPDTARRHQLVVLVAGRRSGKGVLTSALATEALRDRLDYDEVGGLGFLVVSHSKDAACIALRGMVDTMLADPTLVGRLANDTQSYVNFQSDRDIRETGTWVGSQRQAKASLRVSARSAQAKGLRGSTLAFFCLDEPDAMSTGQADDAWLCCSPSVYRMDGTILVVGTPSANRRGLLRRLYEEMGGLSLSIPTWEMNPAIPESYLEERYEEDPALFWAEYGACFVEEVPAYRVVNGPFGSDAAGTLVEQMRRTVRGEKDLHDQVVETYKARVRSTGAEGKHLQDIPVGMLGADGRVVPYTPPPPEASEGRDRVGGHMTLNEIGRLHCAWQDKNFDAISPVTQALALAEETGEVARAILKTHHGIRSGDRGNTGEELADVVLVASGLAARLGIDLDAEVEAKAARRDKKDFRARPETG